MPKKLWLAIALLLSPFLIIAVLLFGLVVSIEIFGRRSVDVPLPDSPVVLTFTFIPKLASPGDVQLSMRDPNSFLRRASGSSFAVYKNYDGVTSDLYQSRENRKIFYLAIRMSPQIIDLDKFEISGFCQPDQDMALDHLGRFSFYEQTDPNAQAVERLNFEPHHGEQQPTTRFLCNYP